MKLTKKQQEIIRDMRNGAKLVRHTPALYSSSAYFQLDGVQGKVTPSASKLFEGGYIVAYSKTSRYSQEYRLTEKGMEVELTVGEKEELLPTCAWYKVGNASLAIWEVPVVKVNPATLVLWETDFSGDPRTTTVQKVSQYERYFETESKAKAFVIEEARRRVRDAEDNLRVYQERLNSVLAKYGEDDEKE